MRYVLVVLLGVSAVVFIVVLTHEGQPTKFAVGDRVRTVVGGYEGQVLHVTLRGYEVRVAKPGLRVDWFSLSGDIESFALSVVWMREHELVPWSED